MALSSFSNIGKSIDEGKVHYQYMYKPSVPPGTTAGYFVDTSMSSGQPKYNAYAGLDLTANVLTGAGNVGIYPGNFIPGSTKHLARWQVSSLAYTLVNAFLMDYLMFYPLIDGDSGDLQIMDNTETLTRYTDGVGVRIMMIATAPINNTASCTITYTNSDGVSGRTVTFNVIPAISIGVSVASTFTNGASNTASLFVNLDNGDKGVRSIESVLFASASGGLMSAVLVKPLATNHLVELMVPTEKTFGFDIQNLPEIKPGAYLNVVTQANGGGTTSISSEFIFINS